MAEPQALTGLTSMEIIRLVNRYIGVDAGYLVGFSYRTLTEFYPEYCNLAIDPFEVLDRGTARERFMAILEMEAPRNQAAIIRGVIERCPVGQPGAPETRTAAYRDELLRRADQLVGVEVTSQPAVTTETVRMALDDAELLARSSGWVNAVDRVHTALHGWLLDAARRHGVPVPQDASMAAILKLMRAPGGPLASDGHRQQDIDMVLNGAAVILGALNPVRNRASLAHPNDQLLEEPEAKLVISVARSILSYLDSRLGLGRDG